MKEIVSFFLSGKKYAVEVSHMQGIEKPRQMNQPPDMPDFLEGVVDIRGEMIPVMAIRKKLTLPAAEKTEKTKFCLQYSGKRHRIIKVMKKGSPYLQIRRTFWIRKNTYVCIFMLCSRKLQNMAQNRREAEK